MRRVLLLVILFAAHAAQAVALRPGIWKSDAYGEIVVVEGDRGTVYDVTRSTCVKRDDSADYPAVEYPAPDRMVVSGSDYRYTLRRIDALPAQCAAPAADALAVFDVFWENLDENYVGFAVRGIDWNAVRAKWRPQITPAMAQADLYALLGRIVEDINDPHVFLSNRKDISYGSRDVHGIARALERARPAQVKAVYHRAARAITPGIEALVRYEVLGGEFKSAFNDKLTWGMLDAEIGYLRASEFVGLFTGMKREEMYPALEKKLDEIFTDLAASRALVIDVSTNTGGAGFIPAAIASRVLREPRVAWTKRARTPNGISSETFELRLEPSVSVRFKGPVVVLISNNSVSAGEELPLLLGGLPYVTLVGETTPGAVSDILMKPLPDGGLLGLPNEQLIAANGRNYDFAGIAPDIQLLVWEPRHPLTGFARAIGAAQAIAHELVSRRP